MEIQIANEIRELLFAHGQIALPSMGTFLSDYQAANIDHSKGQIIPPQYRVKFDAGLPIEDGLLLEHLCQKYSISLNDARRLLDNFMAESRKALAEGDRVNIPEVGRFYSDFAHKIQFLPENTPFNPDTYGMPSVRLQPLSRMQAAGNMPNVRPIVSNENIAQANIKIPTPINKQDDEIKTIMDLFTPAIFILIALTIITVVMYYSDLKEERKTQYKPVPIENVPSTTPKINVPPPTTPNYGSKTAPQTQPIRREAASTSEQHEFTVKSSRPKVSPAAPIIFEEADYNPNARVVRECSVIVGGYPDAKSTKRAIDAIENFGYQYFTDYRQDKNVVGCRFSYESMPELQRRLNALRTKFGEQVVIIKK